jgi:DNA-binding winged helix-turn-helix (wHTH) protein
VISRKCHRQEGRSRIGTIPGDGYKYVTQLSITVTKYLK